MTPRLDAGELSRRLPWLLVFRAGVATVLLILTLIADLGDSPLRLLTLPMYSVAIGTYVVVMVLGLLLRGGVAPVVLGAVHLATTVMAALVVVSGSGGIESALSFLYLLAILDGAIIGGRQIAIVLAAACSAAFLGQGIAEMYDLLPSDTPGGPGLVTTLSATFTHVAGFFLVALLAGFLADLMRRAGEAATTASFDLQRLQRLQDAVLEALPAGVITVDAAGTVLTANVSAARLLGAEPRALLGQRLPLALESLLASGEGAMGADITLAGKRRHLVVARSPVPLPGDASAGVSVVVLDDRTRVHALELDLEAKARLAALGELAGAIAHEIRNPLAAISGAVELLLSDPGDSKTRARLQDIVLREIERMNHLVGDFLMYARPAPPQPIETDMRALAVEVIEMLARGGTYGRDAVRLAVTDGCRAKVDPRQLRQLIANLVRNGLEASGENGSVELNIERNGADLAVEVRDVGPGIEADVLPHVFEPFHSGKRGGNGLGLAVVRRIAELHQGSVAVESRGARGTVVRVLVPGALPATSSVEASGPVR